jgi:hypothetical protein
MQKLILVLVLAIIGSVVFGQARTNAEKPQFLPVQSEILTKATGWAYNESIGEWIHYNNVISTEKEYKNERASLAESPRMLSHEKQNFISIQTRMFTYKGINYYLLIVRKWVGWYEYPTIHSGWDYAEDIVGYIFSVDEFKKLENINGLVALKAIGGAGGGAGRKYNDAAWLDSIQSILMKRTEPEQTGSIFPVLKSEEGNIRFCVPSYVGIFDKNPFYESPFNFNKGYFETTPEEFSKLTKVSSEYRSDDSFRGDPSGILIGTWFSVMGNDLKFEGNQFLISATAGGITVNALIGMYSYNDGILILNVTGGVLSKEWMGQHQGNASVEKNTLECSDFEGYGATLFNVFPFTRKY